MAGKMDPPNDSLDFNHCKVDGEPKYQFGLTAQDFMTTELPPFPEWEPKGQLKGGYALHSQAPYSEEPDPRSDEQHPFRLPRLQLTAEFFTRTELPTPSELFPSPKSKNKRKAKHMVTSEGHFDQSTDQRTNPRSWPAQSTLPGHIHGRDFSTHTASSQIRGGQGSYQMTGTPIQDVAFRGYDTLTHQRMYGRPGPRAGMGYQVVDGLGEGLSRQHFQVDGNDTAEFGHSQQHHASQAMPWTVASITETTSLRKEVESLQAENFRLSQAASEVEAIKKDRDRYKQERNNNACWYRIVKSELDEALKDTAALTAGAIVGSKELLSQECTNLKRELVILRGDNRTYMDHNKILMTELRDIKQKTGEWDEFWQRHFASQGGSQELLATHKNGDESRAT